MSPVKPDKAVLHTSYVDDQINVCIIVLVGATTNKVVCISMNSAFALSPPGLAQKRIRAFFAADLIVCPSSHGNDCFVAAMPLLL